MSLIKALEELKDQPTQIAMDANQKEELEETKEEVQAEPEKQEEAHEDKEPLEKDGDEGDGTEAKDDAQEVKGYKERKIKAAEKREQEARERADRLEAQLLEVTKTLAQNKHPAATEEKPKPKDFNTDPQGFVKEAVENQHKTQQTILDELASLKRDRAMADAKAYVAKLESDFVKKNPDYDEAMKHGFDKEVEKQKLINPRANEAEIRANLENEKIKLAAHFQSLGQDPIEGMYKMMKQVYGYQAPAQEDDKADEGKNLEAVKKNKAKSATALTAGGRTSNTQIPGADAARKITVAQFQKMSPADRDRVFSQKR